MQLKLPEETAASLRRAMMGGWEISGNEVVGDELPRRGGWLDDNDNDGLPTRRGGWLDDDDNDGLPIRRGGWLDDRMQLKLPEETAASLRRSQGDGSFYSRLTQSLGNAKEQVENTFRAPGFQ